VVQVVVVGAHPNLSIPSDTPIVAVTQAVAPSLGGLVALGGVISILGFIAGNALGTPRYAFAAAEDGYLPRGLAAVHPRFQTPSRAIVFTCALAAALTLGLDYRSLIGMSNLSVAAQYLATSAAIPVLRRRAPRAGFRAPGGIVTPVLGVLVSLWIFTEGSPTELVVTACALSCGVVLALVSRRAAARVAAGAPPPAVRGSGR
jgi:amino acid transporter